MRNCEEQVVADQEDDTAASPQLLYLQLPYGCNERVAKYAAN